MGIQYLFFVNYYPNKPKIAYKIKKKVYMFIIYPQTKQKGIFYLMRGEFVKLAG